MRDAVEFEALLGFDGGPVRAARGELGPLRLYTPVVPAAEFDTALAYLVRRLQEAATPGNFLAALPDLADPGVFDREAEQFSAALAAASACLRPWLEMPPRPTSMPSSPPASGVA